MSGMRCVAALIVLGLMGIASPRSPAAPPSVLTVTDDLGRPWTLSHTPTRIITLLPSLTETVCALNACDRLIATDRYSNWPDAVRALPKLGGLDDTSIEAIVTLKPDLVLVSRSARVINRLQELNVPVLAFEPTSLEGSHQLMITIARVLGNPAQGERAWAQLDNRIQRAARRIPPRFRNQRVYFQVSEAPYAASASSFIGEVLDRLSLGNAVPASLGPFPRLSAEFVVRADPDLIMAAQTELVAMPWRPGFDGLSALKRHRTCGFTAAQMDVLVRPGPRLGEAADIIANCLVQLPTTESP